MKLILFTLMLTLSSLSQAKVKCALSSNDQGEFRAQAQCKNMDYRIIAAQKALNNLQAPDFVEKSTVFRRLAVDEQKKYLKLLRSSLSLALDNSCDCTTADNMLESILRDIR